MTRHPARADRRRCTAPRRQPRRLGHHLDARPSRRVTTPVVFNAFPDKSALLGAGATEAGRRDETVAALTATQRSCSRSARGCACARCVPPGSAPARASRRRQRSPPSPSPSGWSAGSAGSTASAAGPGLRRRWTDRRLPRRPPPAPPPRDRTALLPQRPRGRPRRAACPPSAGMTASREPGRDHGLDENIACSGRSRTVRADRTSEGLRPGAPKEWRRPSADSASHSAPRRAAPRWAVCRAAAPTPDRSSRSIGHHVPGGGDASDGKPVPGYRLQAPERTTARRLPGQGV